MFSVCAMGDVQICVVTMKRTQTTRIERVMRGRRGKRSGSDLPHAKESLTVVLNGVKE